MCDLRAHAWAGAASGQAVSAGILLGKIHLAPMAHGTLNTLTAHSLAASGTFDVEGKLTGSFTLSLDSDDGTTWAFAVKLSGVWSLSYTGTLTSSEDGAYLLFSGPVDIGEPKPVQVHVKEWPVNGDPGKPSYANLTVTVDYPDHPPVTVTGYLEHDPGA